MANRRELINALAEKAGCRQYEAEKFLDAFKDVITEYLVNDETVRIHGFLKAEVKEYKGRIGRNPKTNEKIEISSCKKVRFTSSENLNKAVNKKSNLA